jgi:hypothetical protein
VAVDAKSLDQLIELWRKNTKLQKVIPKVKEIDDVLREYFNYILEMPGAINIESLLVLLGDMVQRSGPDVDVHYGRALVSLASILGSILALRNDMQLVRLGLSMMVGFQTFPIALVPELVDCFTETLLGREDSTALGLYPALLNSVMGFTGVSSPADMSIKRLIAFMMGQKRDLHVDLLQILAYGAKKLQTPVCDVLFAYYLPENAFMSADGLSLPPIWGPSLDSEYLRAAITSFLSNSRYLPFVLAENMLKLVRDKCLPIHDAAPEEVARLCMAMLHAYLPPPSNEVGGAEATSNGGGGQDALQRRISEDYIVEWLQRCAETHFNVLCQCCLPAPPGSLRNGWLFTSTSPTERLLHLARKIIGLVHDNESVFVHVLGKVLPYWLDECSTVSTGDPEEVSGWDHLVSVQLCSPPSPELSYVLHDLFHCYVSTVKDDPERGFGLIAAQFRKVSYGRLMEGAVTIPEDPAAAQAMERRFHLASACRGIRWLHLLFVLGFAPPLEFVVTLFSSVFPICFNTTLLEIAMSILDIPAEGLVVKESLDELLNIVASLHGDKQNLSAFAPDLKPTIEAYCHFANLLRRLTLIVWSSGEENENQEGLEESERDRALYDVNPNEDAAAAEMRMAELTLIIQEKLAHPGGGSSQGGSQAFNGRDKSDYLLRKELWCHLNNYAISKGLPSHLVSHPIPVRLTTAHVEMPLVIRWMHLLNDDADVRLAGYAADSLYHLVIRSRKQTSAVSFPHELGLYIFPRLWEMMDERFTVQRQFATKLLHACLQVSPELLEPLLFRDLESPEWRNRVACVERLFGFFGSDNVDAKAKSKIFGMAFLFLIRAVCDQKDLVRSKAVVALRMLPQEVVMEGMELIAATYAEATDQNRCSIVKQLLMALRILPTVRVLPWEVIAEGLAPLQLPDDIPEDTISSLPDLASQYNLKGLLVSLAMSMLEKGVYISDDMLSEILRLIQEAVESPEDRIFKAHLLVSAFGGVMLSLLSNRLPIVGSLTPFAMRVMLNQLVEGNMTQHAMKGWLDILHAVLDSIELYDYPSCAEDICSSLGFLIKLVSVENVELTEANKVSVLQCLLKLVRQFPQVSIPILGQSFSIVSAVFLKARQAKSPAILSASHEFLLAVVNQFCKSGLFVFLFRRSIVLEFEDGVSVYMTLLASLLKESVLVTYSDAVVDVCHRACNPSMTLQEQALVITNTASFIRDYVDGDVEAAVINEGFALVKTQLKKLPDLLISPFLFFVSALMSKCQLNLNPYQKMVLTLLKAGIDRTQASGEALSRFCGAYSEAFALERDVVGQYVADHVNAVLRSSHQFDLSVVESIVLMLRGELENVDIALSGSLAQKNVSRSLVTEHASTFMASLILFVGKEDDSLPIRTLKQAGAAYCIKQCVLAPKLWNMVTLSPASFKSPKFMIAHIKALSWLLIEMSKLPSGTAVPPTDYFVDLLALGFTMDFSKLSTDVLIWMIGEIAQCSKALTIYMLTRGTPLSVQLHLWGLLWIPIQSLVTMTHPCKPSPPVVLATWYWLLSAIAFLQAAQPPVLIMFQPQWRSALELLDKQLSVVDANTASVRALYEKVASNLQSLPPKCTMDEARKMLFEAGTLYG